MKQTQTLSNLAAGLLPGLLLTLNTAAATITVTTTADSGSGSLRQAILDANADTSTNDVSIEFNIPGSGVQTIAPTTGLPTVSRAVTIDGYTQPGASPNTQANGDNAVLLIELSGANLGANSTGLYLTAPGCTVRGLVVNRFSNGIWLYLAHDSVVEGNFIGTDASGRVAPGNFDGLVIGAANTQIGGLTPSSRNLFGGNQDGIVFFGGDGGMGSQVIGNYIGVGADGSTMIPNTWGVRLGNSSQIQVGGRTPAARNVISGNQNGIWADSGGQQVIQGNFIGTDATGTLSRGNVNGMNLSENSGNNLIGGTEAGAGNLISGNLDTGVVLYGTNNVVAGNLIGTDVTGGTVLGTGNYGVYIGAVRGGNTIGGTNASARNVITGSAQVGVAVYGMGNTNNAVLGNSIFGNGRVGIDLGFDGWTATPNDTGDADDGANHLQNFPYLSSVKIAGRNLKVDYRVDSAAANSAYPLTIEFFIADGGQGRTFLYRDTYTTPQATNSIVFKPVVLPAVGDQIVATATDASGNTSEFSFPPVAVTRNGNGQGGK